MRKSTRSDYEKSERAALRQEVIVHMFAIENTSRISELGFSNA